MGALPPYGNGAAPATPPPAGPRRPLRAGPHFSARPCLPPQAAFLR